MNYLEFKRIKESDYIIYRAEIEIEQADYIFKYCYEIIKFESGYQVNKGDNFNDMRVLNTFSTFHLLREAKTFCEEDFRFS